MSSVISDDEYTPLSSKAKNRVEKGRPKVMQFFIGAALAIISFIIGYLTQNERTYAGTNSNG